MLKHVKILAYNNEMFGFLFFYWINRVSFPSGWEGKSLDFTKYSKNDWFVSDHQINRQKRYFLFQSGSSMFELNGFCGDEVESIPLPMDRKVLIRYLVVWFKTLRKWAQIDREYTSFRVESFFKCWDIIILHFAQLYFTLM